MTPDFLIRINAALDKARKSRREADLRIAADLMNSRQFNELDGDEQVKLSMLYAEAHVAVTGGLHP